MPAPDGLRVAVTASRSGSEQVAALRRRGAAVVWTPVLSAAGTDRAEESVDLLDAVAHRRVEAVTFTSPTAVRAMMNGAQRHGMTFLVLSALRSHVAVVCAGEETRGALAALGVEAHAVPGGDIGGLVDLVVRALHDVDVDPTIRLGDGRLLTLRPESVLVDDEPVKLTPAPEAVLRVLAQRPGHVVARAELLGSLPSGTAGSEHAVETAVARLRQVVGASTVETLVKRGYRLAVS